MVVHFPTKGIVLLIKLMDLKFIFGTLRRLNKHFRDVVEAENYILFKHFLVNFNLPTERLKRTNIPARAPIKQIIQENINLREAEPAQDLKPYCYYTDGGTYNDDTKYFINNIFSTSGVCYSSKVPTNTNI